MLTSKRNAVLKGTALFFILLGASGLAFSYWVGGQLVAPRPTVIGPPPADLHAVPVVIAGKPRPIHGWWISGDTDKGSALLLHGIRANRTAMVGRARLLAKHGYSVLLVDLQAHGESSGEAITLGLRESAGVQSAREWIRSRRPSKPIAAIGVSLGGASILLGPSPSGFDAVVLEAVYPDAQRALRNRMAMRFGYAAPLLSRLLEVQIKPRLGISMDKLQPIDHIAAIGAPVMVIAGGRDQHTTPAESVALFARAKDPKEYWLLAQAAHQDFQHLDPAGYEARVMGFLQHHLPDRAASAPSATASASGPAQAGN